MTVNNPPVVKPAGAAAYNTFMGRWSRVAAIHFLEWLAIAPGARWLDVGCGTGVLSGAILETAAPREVIGIDPAADYVELARSSVMDPNCRFLVGDAQDLPETLSGFDAVVSGLVINLIPNPAAALRRMHRVARPGGVIGAYVWDFAEGMQIFRCMWDAARSLDPTAAQLDQGVRYTICRPEPLRTLFANAGLRDIAVSMIEIPTVFASFDDYWTPFLSGEGTAPGYVMSLNEELRGELRECIRAAVPIRPDGTIPLTARAWLVRGDREPGAASA